MSNMTEKSQDKNKTTNSESTEENKPKAAKTFFIIKREDIGNAQLEPLLSKPLPVRHKDWVHSTPKLSTPGFNAVDPPPYRNFNVFTAGSIEMGNAVNWQPLMANHLRDLPITVCDPRRPDNDWNPAMARVPDDNGLTGMQAQIDWELNAQDRVTVICFFFDVDTNSPVSRLELGLFAKSNKVVVCCDDRYHKWDNVKATCERYKIPFAKTFEEFVPKVRNMLGEKGLKLPEAKAAT